MTDEDRTPESDVAHEAASADAEPGEQPVADGDSTEVASVSHDAADPASLTGELEALQESLDAPPESWSVEQEAVEPREMPGEQDSAAGEDAAVSTELTPLDIEPQSGSVAEVEPITSAAAGQEEAAPELPLPGEVDMGPERGGSALWVWVGLGVGVLVAALAAGYVWWYSTSRPVPVPAVTGKLPAQAVQTLNDVGLRLGELSEVPTDAAPPGTVVEQSPAAATELKPGDPVALVVAGAPTVSEVPAVVGQSLETAAATLADVQLSVKEIAVFQANTAVGSVASQIPTAGAELAPGAAVALIVSKGPVPTQIRVPQLAGLPEVDAETLVAARGLRAVMLRSFDASIAAGTVLKQWPAAGSSALLDGYVQYLVSAGPGSAGITMPNLVNEGRKAAQARLEKLGLKVTAVRAVHASVAKNRVIAQMPPSGSKVAKGATVGLVISSGPDAETKVPDVGGATEAEATKAVGDAGFVPVVVQIDTDEHPPGTVFAQYPSAGSPLQLRLSVVFAVAK